MNLTPRRLALYSWSALVIVLLLLGTASWLVLRENFNQDLTRMRASSERELRTIAAFLAGELQAGRYQDIERLLRGWGETNADIARLQLVADNGFVLATYQRAGEVEHALTLDQAISYSYRGEATLHLRLDLAGVYRHRQSLMIEIAIIHTVGGALLFLLVYVALQRQREAVRLRLHTHELDAVTHALVDSEERLKLALEASRDGLWDWDVQTNEAHLSPRWKEILGYAADELGDSLDTWVQRLHPEDRPRVLATLQAHFDDPACAFNPEYRIRHKSGDWVWVQSRGKVVKRDADGRPRRMIGTITDISARIKAEQEGRRTQVFLNSVVENLPVTLFVKDAQTLRYVRFNKVAEDLLGYSRDEMLGKSDYDFFPKDEADFFVAKDKEVLIQKALHDIPEEPIQTRHKGVRTLHTKKIPILDEIGQPLYLLGISEDITERKQAEKALQEATERFRQALRAARAGAWEWNMVTNQATWSEENFAVLGLDPRTHQASFENWFACVHPEDRERASREIKTAQDTGRDFNLEFRVVWPNGEVRWINDVGRLVFDETGRPTSMYGIQIDISERKQAQDLKDASILQQRAIVNASPVPKALNDEHQNIIFLNPAFTETFGYTREDIPTLADWWPKAYPDPEYRQWVAKTWQTRLDKCLRDGTAFPPIELNVRCKDGTFKTVLASAAPIGKSFAGVHLVVLYDITERKQAEEERARIIKELEQRNQEMESFVYTISHDLKSPLITISGFAHMLAKDLEHGDKERGRESLEEIRKASQGMQQLIEDLLLLSRTGQMQGEPEDIDLRALLDDVLARCASHIERERATIRIVSPLPRLRVDRTRFTQLLQNLLDNGVKFHREGVDPVLEIGAEQDAGEVRLYVRDNGIGIEKPYQEKIFGLFQRLDTNREGTGVGLTIARRVVEQHGGRLWVESEPGRGSTFWISLPDSVIFPKGTGESAKVYVR